MEPLTLGLLGLGAYDALIGRPNAVKKQNQIRAAEIRYSPWTKIQPSTDYASNDTLKTMLPYAGTAMQIRELNKRAPTGNIYLGSTPLSNITDSYVMPSMQFNRPQNMWSL